MSEEPDCTDNEILENNDSVENDIIDNYEYDENFDGEFLCQYSTDEDKDNDNDKNIFDGTNFDTDKDENK